MTIGSKASTQHLVEDVLQFVLEAPNLDTRQKDHENGQRGDMAGKLDSDSLAALSDAFAGAVRARKGVGAALGRPSTLAELQELKRELAAFGLMETMFGEAGIIDDALDARILEVELENASEIGMDRVVFWRAGGV